jgi:hypothetical protein
VGHQTKKWIQKLGIKPAKTTTQKGANIQTVSGFLEQRISTHVLPDRVLALLQDGVPCMVLLRYHDRAHQHSCSKACGFLNTKVEEIQRR